MSGPLVTIGLPVYNSEEHVQESLDSLLAQTYGDFVLIISDNASTDRTPEICKTYAASDRRIQYSRNEINIGNPGNFNRVFGLSSTKYLKWSTSDDLWAPTMLERAMEVMEADDTIALCYPKTWVVSPEHPDPQPYEDKLHLMGEDPVDRFLTLIDRIGLAHQHLGVIRTSMLRQTHLLRPHVGSDVVFLAELTLYGKYFELPERLFYRRFHPKSGSWRRTDERHQRERYLAANAKRMRLLNWRRHAGWLAAVPGSPLPARSKARLIRRILRLGIANRGALLADLLSYVRSLGG